MAKYDDNTRLPNGLAQFAVIVGGGTAGAHACAVADVGDGVVQVSRLTLTTAAAVSSVTDLTSEFTTPVATDGYINNASGTNSTSALLVVTLAKGRDNSD